MKLARTIIIGIALSLIMQSILLLFLNDYYFSDKEVITYKPITKIEKPINKYIEIKVPSGVKDIQTSFDGKYITYYTDKTLNVVATSTGQNAQVQLDTKSIKAIYKWLPDRNIIIIAETQVDKGRNIVKFFSYDVKNNIKRETRDYMNDRDVYITAPNSTADIIDIAFNVTNTITYPKISINSSDSIIYRVDVALPIEKLALATSHIGKIKVSNLHDEVIYEDLLNKKIYFGISKTPLTIKDVSAYSLIDVDKDSRIYVGKLENDKITAVYYGDIKASTESWKCYTFIKPVDQTAIFVSSKEKILACDTLKNTIKDLATEKETKYDGTFVTINDKTIISLINGDTILQTDIN